MLLKHGQVHDINLLYRKPVPVLYYNGCSESNASFFVMFTYDFKGGSCLYGSRCLIFPHFVTTDDEMVSDMEVHVKQNYVV